MTKTTTGWVLFIAALSMMFGLMAVDVSNLTEWRLVFSPGFIGSAMAHLSVVGISFVGGKLIPAERDTTERTRDSDKQPVVVPPQVVVVNTSDTKEP